MALNPKSSTYNLVKRELVIFAILLVLSVVINVYSLLKAGEIGTKLFKHFQAVIGIAVLLYMVVGMVRLSVRFFKRSVKSYEDFSKPEDF